MESGSGVLSEFLCTIIIVVECLLLLLRAPPIPFVGASVSIISRFSLKLGSDGPQVSGEGMSDGTQRRREKV